MPEHAPEAWSDRERLWNDVEAFEVRKDAQLAREVEFAIPRELTQAQGIELARDFARSEFVGLGMVGEDDRSPSRSDQWHSRGNVGTTYKRALPRKILGRDYRVSGCPDEPTALCRALD